MSKTVIHRGGPFNAMVFLVAGEGEAAFVEKDFSSCPWIVRNTIGRLLVWRELLILRRLAQTGVVPLGAERVSTFAFREKYCPGPTLRDILDEAEIAGHPNVAADSSPLLPRSFFEALREGIEACHCAGFVHLDLHNARNVIVRDDMRPVILDWQSAMTTRFLPRPIRRALEKIDIAGVYKFWDRFRPCELDRRQMSFLGRSRFFRKYFWIPRFHANQTENPESAH